MNINEFKQKHSDLIIDFEKTTGKHAIWHDEITNPFIEHLQEKNIKINYKPPKILIPKRYHYLPHISEFFLKFFQDNTYFTKKRVTDEYILKYKPPENECVIIKKEFWIILRHLSKYGIIERHSISTYKINKEKVSLYSKNY